MAAYERVTLNRGGRNSRFDCIDFVYACLDKFSVELLLRCK